MNAAKEHNKKELRAEKQGKLETMVGKKNSRESNVISIYITKYPDFSISKLLLLTNMI